MQRPWAVCWAVCWALVCVGAMLLGGCTAWNPLSRRSQSPDTSQSKSTTSLVGGWTIPYGMFPVEVESIALVTRLPGTGSDPAPSVQRAALLADMKARNVAQPSQVLASTNTAMVMVRGVLRPGIQAGDRFDIEVRTATQDESTSLRGGWLMETRLKELAVLPDNQLHEGRVWGLGEGAVLIDPSADAENNPVLACRGRVLGGGRALRSRSVGLVLKPEHQNVFKASMVANAVNKRFHKVVGRNIQQGVAKAHNDQYIELAIHPRYKDNVDRYVQIIRSVALRESPSERIERLSSLGRQLLDPITAAEAARQLEAIGRDGVEPLLEGIASSDPEVRFRSAEALAYLDRNEAAEPLGEAARNEPAFRVFALTALSAMNDYAAYEQLCSLLDVPSAETRYGAFRALWAMNPNDRRVRGETLGEEFSYHVLATTETPMIHITRSSRPELVLFGQNQRFTTPLMLEAGPRIRVNSTDDGEISVSKFAVGEPDQKRIVSSKVDDVIRSVVELGGTYPDIVQLLQQAKVKDVLPSRFEVDALPQAGRQYQRVANDEEMATEAAAAAASSGKPWSQWFGLGGKSEKPATEGGSPTDEMSENPADEEHRAEDARPVRSFFAKMTGRDTP